MSTFLLIVISLGSASFLCALLIISAALVSSRSTRRIASREIADIAEEAAALQKLNAPNVQPRKHKSTPMVLP